MVLISQWVRYGNDVLISIEGNDVLHGGDDNDYYMVNVLTPDVIEEGRIWN